MKPERTQNDFEMHALGAEFELSDVAHVVAGERNGPRRRWRGTGGRAIKYENRGNEAKKSLKTNEVAQKMCAKRTENCAQETVNEAKKAVF